MTNFEKYAAKIEEMLTIERNETDCTISKLRGIGSPECLEKRIGCAECALENIVWLQQEYSDNCTTCKHYRKIECENKYYACLKEGRVMPERDEDAPCVFLEEK